MGKAAVGAGLGLLGHLAAFVVMYVVFAVSRDGRSADDLEAGGSFAVTFMALVGFGAAQIVLMIACLTAAIILIQRAQPFSIGLMAGWGVGVLLVVAAAVAFYVFLDYRSPYY
jgi:hypothetical protein